MCQNDYEKVAEVLNPLKERIKVMIGDGPYAAFSFTPERTREYNELKDKMKKENLYLLGAILWLIMWVCVQIFFSHIIIFVHSLGADTSMLSIFAYIPYYIGVIGAFLLLFKWYIVCKQNKELYEKEIVQNAIREVLPNAICRPLASLNMARLYRLGIVPKYNSVSGSYYIGFKKNGQKCAVSNMTLKWETENSKGHTKSRTVFSGQGYILRYKSQLSGMVRIMTTSNDNLLNKETLDGFLKIQNGEQKIETENVVFNEDFDVYATDGHSAFYCLSPFVMERLMEMKRKYGSFGVAITGSSINIALNSNFTLFSMPVTHGQIDDMSIEKSKQELRNVLQYAQSIEDSINGVIKQ